MTITLSREQQEWLESQVKAGVYGSVDEAVASILAEHMVLDIDDMAWAKPLVDEGRASLDRGEGIPVEEHLRRITERLESLKSR